MSLSLVVADDAPFILDIVQQIVAETDIKVVGEAYDGDEVIRIVKAVQPDIVLMDLVMPKKNGVMAAKAIKEALPKTKIIAFSSVNQEELAHKALAAGCCDFVTKPFTKDDLLRAIYQAAGQELQESSAL